MTTIALNFLAGAVFGSFPEGAVNFELLDLNGAERGTVGVGSIAPEWPRPNSRSPCSSNKAPPCS